MELLAPAGTFSAFEAALEQGADAVYVGAPGFNARALAKDFTFQDIFSLAEHSHRHDKKLYVAMNSLVKEGEIPKVVEALSLLSQCNPDALIIQDLGIYHIARKYFPNLHLHASTLMSVHNSMAAEYLSSIGFERVVLARELTLGEMKIIQTKSKAELEVFIHGAMCFSYSGLCLFSSLHGGKSSLRGQCVQPCRRRYQWSQQKGYKKKGSSGGKGGYLFSMNDLCGIDFLPELANAGVSSLKIEGRLKSAEYVRKTVQAYRLAIDTIGDLESDRKKALQEAHQLLDHAMGRKRAQGFFQSSMPTDVITPHMSGSSGLFLGAVSNIQVRRERDGRPTTYLSLQLHQEVSVGDRLRFMDEVSGEQRSFSLHKITVGKQSLAKGQKGQKISVVTSTELPGRKGKSTTKGKLFKIDVVSRKKVDRNTKKSDFVRKKKELTVNRRNIEKILISLAGQEKTLSREKQVRKKYRK